MHAQIYYYKNRASYNNYANSPLSDIIPTQQQIGDNSSYNTMNNIN